MSSWNREDRKLSDGNLGDKELALLNALRDSVMPIEMYYGYGASSVRSTLDDLKQVIKDVDSGSCEGCVMDDLKQVIKDVDSGSCEGCVMDDLTGAAPDTLEALEAYKSYAWPDRGGVIGKLGNAYDAANAPAAEAEAPAPKM